MDKLDIDYLKLLIKEKRFYQAVKMLRDRDHPILEYLYQREMPPDLEIIDLREIEVFQLVQYSKKKYSDRKWGAILAIFVSILFLFAGIYGIFQVYTFGFRALLSYISFCYVGLVFWIPLAIAIFNYYLIRSNKYLAV